MRPMLQSNTPKLKPYRTFARENLLDDRSDVVELIALLGFQFNEEP
jgi:hypothetical protein